MRGFFRGVSIRMRILSERYDGPVQVVEQADLLEISLCESARPAWYETQVWTD
jgi:hypothetical protein